MRLAKLEGAQVKVSDLRCNLFLTLFNMLKVNEEQLKALWAKKVDHGKEARGKRGKGGVELSVGAEPSEERVQKRLKKKYKELADRSERSTESARDKVLADNARAYAQPLIPNPGLVDGEEPTSYETPRSSGIGQSGSEHSPCGPHSRQCLATLDSQYQVVVSPPDDGRASV
ncbi:hypothetical protein NE237_020756 [Protea cynaroides]|uniref:Uncharacterized protein n=1 Tax=Protea cynaroides TaxID=273540 RepID=A0A9Q0H6K1_9MAGN|nr:hypothetical protein NE237_020756 [Protea cynaroides]